MTVEAEQIATAVMPGIGEKALIGALVHKSARRKYTRLICRGISEHDEVGGTFHLRILDPLYRDASVIGTAIVHAVTSVIPSAAVRCDKLFLLEEKDTMYR